MQQWLDNFDKPFEKDQRLTPDYVQFVQPFLHCIKNLWIGNNLNLLLFLRLHNQRIIVN